MISSLPLVSIDCVCVSSDSVNSVSGITMLVVTTEASFVSVSSDNTSVFGTSVLVVSNDYLH